MRVHSPSAEVRGHGPGQGTLQAGKRDVTITECSRSATTQCSRLFSDGHSSGIYSWEYLYELGANQPRLWDEYLEQLKAAGASRDSALTPAAAASGAAGCGHHG